MAFLSDKVWSTHCNVLKLTCDGYDRRYCGRLGGFLPQSSGPLVGGARPAPAARSAEAETPATGSEPTRSSLLDHTAERVAAMVGCPGHREASNRNRVAPEGLPAILALAI